MVKGVFRRTKTIQQTILTNKDISKQQLGRTRGQSKSEKSIIGKTIKKQQAVKVNKFGRSASPIPIRADNRIRLRSKKEEGPQIKLVDKKIFVDNKPKQDIKQNAKAVRRTSSEATAKATAGIVDVVFCCDTTSSMSLYLVETKETIKTIVENIKVKCESQDISVRFGFVCYRDHPPQDHTYVTKVQDLDGAEVVVQFISNQCAVGGGDYPEAVLDGLLDAAKQISWREARNIPSLRYIFHIADAPPHGEEYYSPSFWPKGVPSGVTLDQVSYEINIREIHYRLINLREKELLKMTTLFKARFTNYDETTLENAKQLNIKISDMIIRELLPELENVKN